MYSGTLLFCNNSTQQQCLSRKLYTCSNQESKPTDKIRPGTIVFLYNTEDKSLLGPFTALEEGGEAFDSGAWTMNVDEHVPSEDIGVTWEELHIIDNAFEKLPFLKDKKTCALTALETQNILDQLRQGKLYLNVERNKLG